MRALTFGLVILGVAVLASTSPAADSSQASGGVSVTATYKGKGPVDATHEIFVFLFDHPNVTAGSRPLVMQPITKNGATVSFDRVTVTPVYVVVVYDEKGDYDATAGPPPTGAPWAIHHAPGTKTPAAITPGPAAKVKVTFDGSRRF